MRIQARAKQKREPDDSLEKDIAEERVLTHPASHGMYKYERAQKKCDGRCWQHKLDISDCISIP